MDQNSFLRIFRAKCVCIGVLIFFLHSSIIPSSLFADIDAMLANVQIESGEVSFNRIDPATLEVNASDRAIINFDAFSIAANEVVRFIQPLESSSVLARVVGNSASDIFGALFSNGEFVLINTNGIHFAETANINVGSLIASTLDIQNAVYQAGQYVFEKGEGSAFGQIFNEANIGVTDGGHIAMLGESIRNTGTLTANLGSVVLGLGEKQTLSFDENGLINLVIDRGLVDVLEGQQKAILNEGVINASGGKVVMTVQMLNDTFDTLINNTGVVQANEAVMGEDGVIEFRASGSIENNGTIETDTGKVTIAATGDVESFGELRAARLEESGAAFRVGGEYHVGSSSIDNLDNAITLSTGNYSGTTSDNVNIIVDDNAVITLTGTTVFNADNDLNGSGAFTMNAGSSINGGGSHYSLTIQTGQDSTLRTITNVGSLTLNSSTGAPVYTTNSAITLFGSFLTEANVDLVLGGNLTTYHNLTLSAGTDVSLAANALIYSDIDDSDAGLLTISNTATIAGNGYDLTLGSAGSFTVYGLDNTIKNLSFGNMSAPSTVTMQCDIDITGDLALSHFTDMSTAFNVLVDGDIDFATTVAGNVPSITFTGTNKTLSARDLNISGGADITLAGTDVILTGTFSNDGTLYVRGDETFTGFTNDINSGTVTYTGTGTYSELVAGDNYYNLTFSGAGGGSYTLDAALDVNGNLNIAHASKTLDVSASNHQINVGGTWSNSGTFTAQNGTVIWEGSGTFSPGSSSFYNLTKSSAGTVTLATTNLTVTNNLTISAGTLHLGGRNLTTSGATFSNDGTLRLRGNETLTGFTNDTNSGTIYYDYAGFGQATIPSLVAGNNYYNLTFDGYAGYVDYGSYSLPMAWEANGNVDVNGALNILNGAFDLNGHNLDISGGSFSNTGYLRLQGGETLTGFTNDTDSGTVWYDGAGSYTGLAAGDNYNGLIFWGSGSWTLDAPLDINSNLHIGSGTLDVSAGDHQINLAGYWYDAGSFNERNGTVVLDGGNQTVHNTETFYNFSKTETTNNGADTALTLQGTTTVNGLLTLDGLDNDDRINLTTGNLNANGTFAVDYVDVLASDASGGLKIVHTNTITNGNNYVFNWFAQMYTWIGGAVGAETDFNTGANWDLGSAPGAGDEVWIPDTVYDPILDADADVYGLRIATGAILDLAGFNLEGTGPNMVFLNQGTVRLQGGETITGLAYDVRYGTVQYQGGSGTYTGLALDNYYNLTFSDADSTWVLDAALNVDGNLTISAGTLDVDNAGNYQINTAGNWNATGGTFLARAGTVAFDGVSSSVTDGGNNWYDVNAAGGLAFADATTITNDLIMSVGSVLSGTNDITVNGGDVTGDGTINLTGGTFLLDGTGNFGENSGGWLFHSLTFGNGVGAETTTKSGAVPITVSNNFTIAANQTLDAGDDIWTIGGNFANNGTFTAGTSTFDFNDAGAQTLDTGDDSFSTMTHSGAGTLQLISNRLTVTAAFTNSDGIFDLNGQNWIMTGATFSNIGTVRLDGDEVLTDLTVDTDSGTFDYAGSGNYAGLIAGDAYYHLSLSGSGTYTLDAALDVNGNISINDGVLDVDADDNHQINVGGGWTNAASTFLGRGGKVVFDGIGTIGANSGFNDVEINSAGTVTLGDALDIGDDLIFTNGVLDVSASNHSIYVGGDWSDGAVSDNFNEGNGTVTFDGTGTITVSGDSFNHLTINTAGTVTLATGVDINGNITFTAGTLDVSGSNYQINLAGNWSDTGAGAFTEQGGTVVFDGTSQVVNSNEAFGNIEINSSGTVTLGSNLDVNGNLTFTAGNLDVDVNNNFQINAGGNWTDTGSATFTARSGTVVFDGTGTINSNDAFNNIIINTGDTTTVGAAMDVNGSVTLTAGAFDIGAQLNVAGGWTDTGAGARAGAGAGVIVFDGTEVINSNSGLGAIEITTGGSITLGQNLSAGSLTLSGSGSLNPVYSCGEGCTAYYQITVGAWNDTAAGNDNFAHGLGTVVFDGGGGTLDSDEAFYNVQFTSGTMTLAKGLIFDGSVTFTDGVLASAGYQTFVAGNWTDTGAGGYSGNGLVIFDGTGTINSNTAFYDVQIAGDVTLAGNLDVDHDLTLASGNLDVSASNYQINVGGSWTRTAGSFDARSGLVVFDGGGSINTPISFNDVEINTAGTITLAADLNIGDDLTFTSGTLDASVSNYQIGLGGDWTDQIAGGYTGSGLVVFGGTGTILSDNSFYNLEVNSAGTVTLGAALDVNNNLTVTAGTLDVSASNYQINIGAGWSDTGAGDFNERAGLVVFDGAGTIASNDAFNDIEINASGTVSLGANLDVDDDLVITAGTLSVTPTNYQINVGGDWTDSGAGLFGKENGKVVFDGTGTINSNESFYDVEINTAGVVTMGANLDITAGLSIPAGVLSMNGYWISTTTNFTSGGTLRLQGSETISWTVNDTAAGTFEYVGDNDGNADVITVRDFGANDYYHLKLNAADGLDVFQLGDDADISGDATITAGVFELNGNDVTTTTTLSNDAVLRLNGPENVSWTVNDTNSGTWEYVGFGPIKYFTGADYYNLTINSNGNNFALTEALDVNGSLTLTAGTLDVSGSNFQINVGGGWTDTGAGTFNEGGGTVVFDGTGTINSNEAFNDVTIAGTTTLGAALDVNDDLTISSGSLDVSGSNYQINVGGDWTDTGAGTFTERAGTVVFDGTGTVNSNEAFNDVEINSGGTVTLGAALDMNDDFTLTSGVLDVSGSNYQINVGGDWYNWGTFNAQNGTVVFDGTGGQGIRAGGSSFYNINITNSGDYVGIASDPLTVTNNFIINSGSIFALNGINWTMTGAAFSNEGTLELFGGETLTGFTNDTDSGTVTYNNGSSFTGLIAGDNYYNLSFIGVGTYTLDAALDVNNNLTISSGALDVSASNYQINLAGNWSNSGTFTAQNGTVVFDGASNQTFNPGGSSFYNITDGGSGTLQLQNALTVTNNFTINVPSTFELNGQNWNMTGATFSNEGWLKLQGGETLTGFANDTNSGTVEYTGATGAVSVKDFGASDYYNLIINNSGQTSSLTDALSVAGALTVSGGTFDTALSTVSVSGLGTVSGGTYKGSVSTGNTFNGGLTISGGTYDGNSDSVDVNGDFTLSSGVFEAPSIMFISGNFNRSGGTFTHNSGSVTLDGGNQTISGSTTFYDLYKQNTSNNSTNETLTFTSGTTTTIEGSLNLDGLDANDMLLVRATGASAATINFTGASTFAGDYLDVEYNTITDNSSGISTPLAPANSTNTGNTSGWFATGLDVSGYLYSDEGGSVLTSKTIAISINGAAPAATADSNGLGLYSFTSLAISAGDILTLYLDGETEKGVLVTLSGGVNMTNMNLYADRLIVRNDNGGSITNAHLATADNSGDTDIPMIYTLSGSNLSMASGKELFVWAGHTYAPGGDVTTDYLDVRGTYTHDSEAVTVNTAYEQSGNFSAGSGAIDINGTFTQTAGTFNQGTSALNVSGDMALSNGATFTKSSNSSALTFDGTGSLTDSNGTLQDLGNVVIGGTTTTRTLGDNVKMTGLTINSGNTFYLFNNDFSFSSAAAVVNDGIFKLIGYETLTNVTNLDIDSGTVMYATAGSNYTLKDFGGGVDYYNLNISNSMGIASLGANLDVNGDLDLGLGGGFDQSIYTMNVAGDFSIANGVAFTKSMNSSALTFDGSGSITDSNTTLQDLGAVVIGGSGTTRTLGDDVKMTSLTINNGNTFSLTGKNFEFSNWAAVNNNGVFKLIGSETLNYVNNLDIDSGTVEYAGATGNTTVKDFGMTTDYYNLTINNSGQAVYLGADLDVDGAFTLSSGFFWQQSAAMNIAGDFSIANGGVFYKSGAALTFDGAGLITDLNGFGSLQDLGSVVIGGTGTTRTLGSAVKMTGLTINSGNVFAINGNNFSFSNGASVNNNGGTFRLWGNETFFNVYDLDTNSGTVEFTSGSGISSNSLKDFDYYNLTINDANITYSLINDLDVNGALTLSVGSLDQGTRLLNVGGDFSIANGATFTKSSNSSAFTFDGNGSFSDANATKQDLGVVVNSGIRTVNSGVKMTSLSNSSIFLLGNNDFEFSSAAAVSNTGTFSLWGTQTLTNVDNLDIDSGQVEYYGTSNATIKDFGAVDYYALNILNSGGAVASLGADLNVANSFDVRNTGAFDQSTRAMTVGGGFYINDGGVFTKSSNSSALTFNGTGVIEDRSTSLQDLGAVVIGGTTVTRTLADDLKVTSLTINSGNTLSLAGNNFEFSSAAAVSNEGTIQLRGSETFTNVNNLDINSGTVEYAGSTSGVTIKDFGATDYYNLTVNNSGQTSSLGNSLDVDGALSISTGTFDQSSQTLNVGGNFTIDGNATFTKSSNGSLLSLDGTGSLTDSHGSFLKQDLGFVVIGNNSTRTLADGVKMTALTIDLGSTFDLAGYNFNFNNNAAVSNNGTIKMTGGETLTNVNNLDLDSGTVEYTGAVGTATVKDFGATDYYNLRINGVGNTYRIANSLDLDGSFAITAGTFDQSVYAMDVVGNFSIEDGATFTKSSNSSTLTINGGTLTDNNTTKQDLGEVAAATSSSVTLGSAVKMTNLSVGASTFDLNGYDFSFSSSAAVSNQGYFALRGSETLTNVTNLDTDSGIVLYQGATGSVTVKDFGATDYYNLYINNTGQTTSLGSNVDIDAGFFLLAGTFDQSTRTMNVAENFAITNGATFTKSSSSSALTFDGAGFITDSSAAKQDLGAVVIGNNSTRTLADAVKMTSLSIDNGSTFAIAGNNFEFSGATAVSNEGTFKLHGSETLTNVNNLDTNSGTVEYTGATGSVTVKDFGPGITDYYNLTINNSGQTTDIFGGLEVDGAFTLSAGTFSLASYSMSVAGDFSLASGTTFTKSSDLFGALTFDGTGSLTDLNATKQDLGNMIIAGGTRTLNDAVKMTALTIDSGEFNLNGNNFEFSSAAAVSNNGAYFTLRGSETLTNVTNLDIDSGIVRYTGATGTITVKDFGATDYYNLTIDNSGQISQLGSDIDIDGAFSLATGTFDQSAYAMNVSSHFSANDGTTFTKSSNSSALTFDGTGYLTDSSATKQDLGAVVISNNSTRTLQDAVKMTSLSIGSGSTLDLSGNNFDFTSSAAVNNSGIFALKGSETLTNVTNLDIDSGTVEYTGATGSATVKDFGSTDYYNLTINNSGQTTSLGADIDIDSAFSHNGGSFSQGNYTMNVAGDFTLTSGNVFSKSSNGSAITFDGNGILTDGGTQDLGAVVIGNNSTRALGAAASMTSLTINSGSTFNLDGNNFSFSGSAAVSNNGTFKLRGSESLTSVTNLDTDSGTVEYTGATSLPAIADFGAGTDYYNLVLNNSGQTMQLSSDLDVDGTFTLSSGTFNQSSYALYMAGDFSIVDGATFTKSNNNSYLYFDGSVGGNINDASATKQDLGYVYIGGSNTVRTLADDVKMTFLTIGIGNAFSIDGNNFEYTSSLSVSNAGTFRLRGSETLTNVTTLGNSDGTVEYTGATGNVTVKDFNFGGGEDYYNLIINNAGQTTSLGADIDVNANFTVTAGAFDQSAYAMNVGYDFSIANGATFTKSSNSSALTFDGTGSLVDSSVTLQDLGNVEIGGTTTTRTIGSNVKMTSLHINNGNTFSLGDGGNRFEFLSAAAVSNEGTFQLTGAETIQDVINFDIDSGTVEYTGATGSVTVKDFGAGADYYNLKINNSGQTTSLGSGVDIDGAFTLSAGTFSQSTSTMNIAGDFSLANGTAFTKSSNSSALTFDGTGNLTDSNATKQDLGSVVIGGSTTTRTLADDVRMTSLTIDSDNTFSLDGNNFTFSSAAAILNDGTIKLQGSETFTNVNNPDTQSGTVEFTGDGDSFADTFTITEFGTGFDYYNLKINSIDSNDVFQLGSNMGVFGAFTLSQGTFQQATSPFFVLGDFSLASNTVFTKASNGSNLEFGSGVLTDLNAVKQDLGNVYLDAATRSLGSDVKMTSLTIDAVSTFSMAGNNLEFTSAAAVVNNGTFRLQGGETLTNVTNLDTNSGTVEYVGDGDSAADTFNLKTFSGTDYYNLRINLTDTNDVVQVGTDNTYAGLLTVSQGTFNADNRQTFAAFTISGGTLTLGTDSTFSGAVNINGGAFNPGNRTTFNLTVDMSAGTVTSGTNFVANDPVNISGGTLSIGSDSAFNDSMTLSAGSFSIGTDSFFYGTTLLSGGTFTGNNRETFAGLTVSGATVTSGTDNVINGTLNISSGSFAPSSRFDLNGDFLLSGTGSFSLPGTTTMSGNWSKTGGTFTQNGQTVAFDKSSGTQTLDSGGTSFVAITHSGAGTLQLTGNDLTVGSFTNSGGVFDLNGRNFSRTSSGAVSNTAIIQLRGSETLTNITNLDTDSGTVRYVGDGDSASDTFTIKDFGASDYYNLVINSTDGTTDTYQISGALDVNGALTVSTGTTFNLNGQNLDLTGGSFSNDGTLRMQGGETLTSFTNDTDSGTIEYDGTGSYSDLNLSEFYNVTFSGSGGTWEPANDEDIFAYGTLSILSGATLNLNGQGMDLTGGTFVNDGVLRLLGDQTLTNFTNDSNSGTIQYDGTQSYLTALAAGNTYYNLTFSGNGGTWEPNGAVDVNGALTVASGATFDLDGQNLDTTGGSFSNDGTLRMQGGETLTSFTNDTNSGTVQYDGTGSYLTALGGGNSYYNLTFSGNGGIWEPNGAVDVNGALTIATGATFDIDGQNLDLAGGSFSNDGTLRMQGGETLTAFTNDTNSGTVQYDGTGSYLTALGGGNSYYNLTFSGNGGTWEPNGAVDVNGALTVATGATFDIDGQNLDLTGGSFSNDGTLRMQGGETLTSFTNDTNSGTVSYDGSGTYASLIAGNNYYGFNISGSGSFTAAAATDVNGAFSQSAGTFVAPATNLTVAGNITRTGGTFTHNSGTVTLDGTSDQAITAGGAVFNDVTVNNTGASGSDDITFTGDLDVDGNFLLTDGNFHAPALMYTGINFTQTGGTFSHNNGRLTFDTTATSILDVTSAIDFFDLYIASTAGKIVQFTGGQTFNVLSANTLNAGNNATLTSTNTTQWNLSVNNAVTAGVAWGSNVTLANVNNISVNPINAVGVINGGGNTGNWTFTAASVGNAAINSVLFFDNVVINQEIGIVNETESSTGETQQNDSQNTNVTAEEPGTQPSEQSGGGGNTGGNTGSNLPSGGDENKGGGGGFWDFGGGNQKGEKKSEKVSYVYVHEGAVDVNSTLVFPGESIGFGADGKAHHRTRAVYVVSGSGVQVVRRNTRTDHKNLKDYQFAEQPAGIAAGKNNSQVYLVLPKSGKVAVMDNAQMRVSRNIYGLEQGAREIAISPDDKQAYVVNSMTDTVNVINLSDNSVVKSIAVGNMPSKVVVSPDGKYVFVTNRLDGTVSKIDPATGETVTTFAAGSSPYGIVMNEDGGKIYVTDTENNVVLMFEESADKKSYDLKKKIEVGKAPHAITYDPIGKKIFVANRNSESVTMIDATTQEVLADIAVGKRPADIEVTPEGDTAYVANELSGSVSYVDLAQKKVLEDIPTGDAPRELTLSNPPKPSRKSPSKISPSSL